MDKSLLRRIALKRRESLSLTEREEKNQLIFQRLISLREFQTAGVVLCYASFRSEVDTFRLIEYLLNTGRRTLLPRVNPSIRELEIREIRSLQELQKGYMGIPEPAPTAPLRDLNLSDIIIIPGIAFDRRGGRIGYGVGYYDKLLSGLRRPIPLVGLAYDEQLLKEIPIEAHDRRVDIIVTEKEVIYCGSGKDQRGCKTHS